MDLIILTLHKLLGDEANFEIRGVVSTEEEYMSNVKINDETPTITWAEVQAKMDELRPQEAMKKLREERDPLLDKTDRYVLSDFPHDSDEIRQAWKDYRQQLRDLPANSPEAQIDLETGELTGVVWPTKPTN
jgi:hypothetical protein